MAPSLISAIKVAGLVVVANTSSTAQTGSQPLNSKTISPILGTTILDPLSSADGVNGVLDKRRILKFYDSIDM